MVGNNEMRYGDCGLSCSACVCVCVCQWNGPGVVEKRQNKRGQMKGVRE